MEGNNIKAMGDLPKEFGQNERRQYRTVGVIDLIITIVDLLVIVVSLNSLSSGSVEEEDVVGIVHQNGTATDILISDKITEISTFVWTATALVMIVSLLRLALDLGMLITKPFNGSQIGDMFFGIWCRFWIFLLFTSGLLFFFVFGHYWYAVTVSTGLRLFCFGWAYKITSPSEGFCKFLCFIPANYCCRRSSV